jgi:hypothetical protein
VATGGRNFRAMSAVTTARRSDAPPPPLVRFGRHPITWVINHVEILAFAVVLAHLGMLVVVALYYMAFELNASATAWWHHTVSNANLRHDIRDVVEGLFGGFLAQQAIYNHYRKHRPRTRVDDVEIALHIPNVKDEKPVNAGQVLAGPPLALLYALPGFWVAFGILGALHIHALHAAHGSLWARTETVWTSNWDKKLMGYSAAFFFGRRPMKQVFSGVQLWFAQRARREHRWLPPTFRARYNDLHRPETAEPQPGRRFRALDVFMSLLIVVGLALAGYGYYILAFVAKGG